VEGRHVELQRRLEPVSQADAEISAEGDAAGSANLIRAKGSKMTKTEHHIKENQPDIPIPKVIINCLRINIII
jgi:hypothetical protein